MAKTKMKIDFTKEELYLIERQFDSAYSLMDMEFRKTVEQFMLIKCQTDDTDKDKKLKYLAGITLRYMKAAEAFRKISEKCEKVRK